MIVKHARDYYERLYEMFPDVPKEDIRRILNFGLKSLYLHNSYGADTLTQDKDFWCYIGNLTNNSIQHMLYYIDKLCVKMRIMYRRKKIEWDGCYYFSPTDEQVSDYQSGKLTEFSNVMLYKIKDECKLRYARNHYIFKVKGLEHCGFQEFFKNIPIIDVELIETHEPLTLKDIIKENSKYDFI